MTSLSSRSRAKACRARQDIAPIRADLGPLDRYSLSPGASIPHRSRFVAELQDEPAAGRSTRSASAISRS